MRQPEQEAEQEAELEGLSTRPMELSDEQKRQYVRDGFLRLPAVIEPEHARRAKAIVDAALSVEAPADAEELPPTGHRRRQSPLYPGRIDLGGAQYEGSNVGAHPCLSELLTGSSLLPLLRSAVGGTFTFEESGSAPGAAVTVVFPCVYPPPARCGCLGYPMDAIPEITLDDGRPGGPWMGHLDGM